MNDEEPKIKQQSQNSLQSGQIGLEKLAQRLFRIKKLRNDRMRNLNSLRAKKEQLIKANQQKIQKLNDFVNLSTNKQNHQHIFLKRLSANLQLFKEREKIKSQNNRERQWVPSLKLQYKPEIEEINIPQPQSEKNRDLDRQINNLTTKRQEQIRRLKIRISLAQIQYRELRNKQKK